MQTGDVWNGWKIDRFLGEGSFGKVYRIVREEFGHTYEAALKVLEIPQNQSEVESIKNEGMDDESITYYFQSIVEDFVNEFALMSKLKGNSNIVSYEDHQVIARTNEFGWTVYIRMELLTPLYQYLKIHTLTIREVIQLGIDMCQALEVCQKYNIIHRDIKPENIFVSDLGKFKLGDFGIARQLEKTSSGLSKKGTYTYMAPEVYKGFAYNSTVDIYSLGIVLYRFLNNNRTPFMPDAPKPIRYSDKENANILRLSGKQMPAPANAEGRLAEIILKACAYNPSDRYDSAADMKSALQSIAYSEMEAKLIYPEGDNLSNTSLSYLTGSVKQKTSEADAAAEPEGAGLADADDAGTVYLFSDMQKENEKRRAERQAKQEAEERAAREAEEAAKREAEEEAAREAEETARREAEEEAAREAEEVAKHEAEKAAREAEEAEVKRKAEEKAERGAKEKGQKAGEFPGQGDAVSEDKAKGSGAAKYKDGKKEGQETEKREEQKTGEQTKNRLVNKKIIIAAGVVVLAIVAAIAVGGIKRSREEAMKCEMPDIMNMSENEAQKALKKEELTLVSSEEYSDTVEKGHIISQDHKAGETLKKGSKIKAVISKGALIAIPELAGVSGEDAKAKAEAQGLSVEIKEEVYSDQVASGVVISQEPAAGSKVEENSRVYIVVSKGIEKMEVPTLKNLSEKEAKSRLKEVGLKYKKSGEKYSDSVEKGKVISQDVKAGKKIEKNSTVSVVISKGKKPAPKADPVPADTTPDTTWQAAPEPTYPQQTAPSQGSGGGGNSSGNSGGGGDGDSLESWDLVN